MPQIDLYARKSKVLAKGDRLREVSTDEQLKRGREWAARNGYTVRREWVELGSAYADKERPEFTGALHALLSGATDAMWNYMYDRFSRKGVEDLLAVLGKARVVFDYDDLDTMNERDRGQLIQEAERARDYSRRLSHRVRDVKATQRDAGEWLGGSAPWGLAVDRRTHKLSPDETPAGGTCFLSRAEMAREMFRWLTAGVSARQIARDLNAMAVPAPRGKHWHPAAILRMLASPAYAGLQVAGGDRKASTVVYRDASGHTVSIGTGLVSADVQRAARDAVAATAPKRGNRAGGKARHLLTDILRCSGCGRSMACVGNAYACLTSRNLRTDCLSPARAGKDVLESHVSAWWLHVVGSLEPSDPLALVVAQRWAALRAPRQTAEHLAALDAVKAAETVRERLNKALTAGAYDDAMDMFTASMKTATADVQAARDELAKHAAPAPDASFINDPELVHEAWKAADLPTRRDLLRLAIDRVTVRKADYRGQRFDGSKRVDVLPASLDEAA